MTPARRPASKYDDAKNKTAIPASTNEKRDACLNRNSTSSRLSVALARLATTNTFIKLIPSHAATVLLGALHSRVFFQHVLGLPATADEEEAYLDRLVDLLWSGLAPEATP